MRVQHSVRVLGVDVDEDLLSRWRAWFAPGVQPFRVDRLHPRVATLLPPTAARAAAPTGPPAVSDEVRDAFGVHAGTWAWFDEEGFDALHGDVRRALMAERRRSQDGRPLPPWPSAPAEHIDRLLVEWLSLGVRPSLHLGVGRDVWVRVARRLPVARALSGTYPSSSGPNSFGTVIAAAGDTLADHVVHDDTFAAWLAANTRPVRGTLRDADPGVVLVWTHAGRPTHAAVTIGGGWALHKPSDAWFSARTVRTVSEVVATLRRPGTRLVRRLIER